MILLASRSPQRSLLLRTAGLAFRVVASGADEEAVRDANPASLALGRARLKARGAAVADGVILGADTVVALGGVEHGTPRDRADALRILRALSGTTHRVITGHWLIRRERGVDVAEDGEVDEAQVTMRALSEAEITAYVASGESDGRAGAYAIQEHGDRFVARRAGAWDTIVGLHLDSVVRLHQRLLGRAPERQPD